MNPAGQAHGTRPCLALQATLAIQLLASTVLSAAPVLAPAVAPTLGVGAERVGAFVAVAYLCAMISGVGTAPWVQRLGAVRVSQWVLLGMGAAAAFATLAGPAWLLLLAAGLLGIAYGGVNPAAAAVLGRHAPPAAPGLFFALKQTGVPLGVALSGLLMPLGLAALGWRGTAWASAGACLLLALLLAAAAPRLDQAPARDLPGGGGWTAGLLAVAREPALRRLAVVSFAFGMAQQGFITFVVSLASIELGFPLALAAGWLAASQAACTVARVALGHAADRWITPRVLLGLLGLAMAAGCLMLGLVRAGAGPFWVGAAVIACGASVMGWNGVYFAELLRSVPRERLAASAGGTQFFTFGGAMLGPLLFGQLVHLGGSYGQGYLCLAAVAAAGGLRMLVPGRAPTGTAPA